MAERAAAHRQLLSRGDLVPASDRANATAAYTDVHDGAALAHGVQAELGRIRGPRALEDDVSAASLACKRADSR